MDSVCTQWSEQMHGKEKLPKPFSSVSIPVKENATLNIVYLQNILQALVQFISHDVYRKSTEVAFMTWESTNHVSLLWLRIEISRGLLWCGPGNEPLEMIASVHISIPFSMENLYDSLLGYCFFLHSQAHKGCHWQAWLHSVLIVSLSPASYMVVERNKNERRKLNKQKLEITKYIKRLI